MARKKSKQKKEIAEGDDCQHCGAFVLYNAPMSGVVGTLGPKTLVICASCALEYMAIQRQIAQRWG